VAFNQNNVKKAVEYFQKALTLVASSEPSNTVAQNRIVAKITLALQTQVQKESAVVERKVSQLCDILYFIVSGIFCTHLAHLC
jgi:hypothetical protein